MQELTAEQIKRQDFVDNAIYHLIRKINPDDKESINKVTFPVIPACRVTSGDSSALRRTRRGEPRRESFFGDVRDVIGEWMVERLTMGDICVHNKIHKWRENHEIFKRSRLKR